MALEVDPVFDGHNGSVTSLVQATGAEVLQPLTIPVAPFHRTPDWAGDAAPRHARARPAYKGNPQRFPKPKLASPYPRSCNAFRTSRVNVAPHERDHRRSRGRRV